MVNKGYTLLILLFAVSVITIGLLIAVSNGFRGLGLFGTEWFVNWGTKRSLGLSSILMSAALFMVVRSGSPLEFLVPLAMYGFAGGIVTPVILDYIAHRAPPNALGIVMGTHEAVYGLGMCMGPIIGGSIAEAFQPSTLYLILAVLSLLILPLSGSLRKG